MLGAGSILAGAFIGAGIGALSTTAMKAGEEISTGNVRSAGERLAYAVFDDSMSWDEKWAYAFDPGQMVADFVTGVVIGEILDGIMAAIQNRLRSIFANYDAAMREAFETSYGESSGNISELLENRPELTGTNREKLLSMVQDTKLAAYINEVYRPGASVGDGGTADKLIMEFYEGSSRHLPKAKERLVGINRIIDSGKLGLNDLDIAEALRDDLEYAIDLFK